MNSGVRIPSPPHERVGFIGIEIFGTIFLWEALKSWMRLIILDEGSKLYELDSKGFLWKTNSGRVPPKEHNTPLEVSYRHLLEIPLHAALQKVRGWVVRLTGTTVGCFS